MTETFAVMNTDTLVELNRLARKADLNRQLSTTFIDALDPEGVHVVSLSMVHNDDHIRVILLCKLIDVDTPVEATLDMSFESYDALARVSRSDDGKITTIVK